MGKTHGTQFNNHVLQKTPHKLERVNATSRLRKLLKFGRGKNISCQSKTQRLPKRATGKICLHKNKRYPRWHF